MQRPRVSESTPADYGADKIWRQLNRERFAVARCTVKRLMRQQGLRGAMRGKPVKTPRFDPAAPCPLDRVNRQFSATPPNKLWNALPETINGLHKAEIIHRRGPWRTTEAVELATLEWGSWFNHRLFEPIGCHISPAEAEASYCRRQTEQAISA